MNKKLSMGFMLACVMAASNVQAETVLDAGRYSAKVTAIVCGGCLSQIEQTMKAQEGVDSPSIDPHTSTLRFSVKAGSSVGLDQLQAALKASSDKMGMGADYRLVEVEKIILAANTESASLAPVS